MATDKKVALITGANKGLGLETARQLGKEGITVLIGARDAGRGNKAVEELRKDGVDAHFIYVDMEKPSTFHEVYKSIEKDYGKLDILVNNAGINAESGGGWGVNTVTKTSPADIRKTFDTNFFNLVELTQILLPLIQKAPAGRIVNLSSILGSLELHANPDSPIYNSKGFAYDASKTALNQFTVHLAHALKDTNVKVNSAHPGWVKTDLGTDSAPMNVVDGAKTSVWLATLPADGPNGGYFHMQDRLPW
jgi:NAD(P)-dependent dehydrogenase (short-subunit alcohol dehydrogenase family)